MEQETKCPLCEAPMDYKPFGKSETQTHIWICPECPGVLFEFYNELDLECLERELTKPWNQ